MTARMRNAITLPRVDCTLIGLVASVMLPVAAHANLILNPSFESGLADWIGTGSAGFHLADGLNPSHSGAFMAFLNAYPGYGSISQTIATEVGRTYAVDFWLASNGGDGTLYAEFGDTQLWNAVNPAICYRCYTHLTYTVVATSVSSTFTIGGTGITATYFIDDVCIHLVPEEFVDCNINGIDDFNDLQSGNASDTNCDGIPDECDYAHGDFDLDGETSGADLGILIAAWGSNESICDIDGNGIVDGADLGILLGNWG